MPARNPGKPGELTLCIGVGLMLIAPFVYVLMGETDRRQADMLARGIVSEAVVTAHDERTETYSGRMGRTRVRTIWSIEVQHDINATTPYTEWQETGAIRASNYPAITTSTIDVPSSYEDDLPVGAQTMVIQLPEDSTSLMPVDQLEFETSLAYHIWVYLGLAAMFVAGGVMTVIGARQRFGHG